MTTHLTATPIASDQTLPRPLVLALQTAVVLTVPLLLTMLAVRLVMTPAYLSLQYNRPDFPTDVYGFTRADRLHYGTLAVEYLLNGADIRFLGDQTFPDGTPLYNARELQHMFDVKVVTQLAYAVALVAAVIMMAAVALLWRARLRRAVRHALRAGALLTLGLIVLIIALSVTSWDFFFTAFHDLFFAEGTWMFLYSDTLIRLFPEQFWFETAVVIGVLTVLGALVLLVAVWRLPIFRSERHV